MGGSDLFTGERFIPGIQDNKLEIEHYQRYLGVRELVRGKAVLDAACGEGYGSSLMAAAAAQVTGVDIDGDTIARAREKYRGQDNLRFFQGSVEKLPLADASVDAVVSFETIEHVPEEVQRRFLTEIARVLRPEGILVMSTPNKKIYSDLYNYKNEFHIKEFYHDEFLAFLGEKFRYVKLYNQAFQVASILSSGEESLSFYTLHNLREGSGQDGYDEDGKYYIALASNRPVETAEGFASVFLGETGEYEKTIRRIVELQTAEEVRNGHIEKLNREAEAAGETIRKLQAETEERNAHIRLLDGQIEQLRAETQAQAQTIRNKEGHIGLLLEVERAYEHEKTTYSYKFGKKLQRMGDAVLPPKSRRRFFARVLLNVFRHPKLMLHVINPKRIRNYVKYSRLEGMDGVRRRYEEAVDIERSHIEPAGQLDLEMKSPQVAAKSAAEYEKLVLPVWDEPLVSIVIPAYNQFDYTYRCVKSILRNSGDIAYEIILADDCSTDLTRETGGIIENIRVITTEENVRFLRNCNHAAKYAKGSYILFLNNDTQVQPDWLEPLVRLMGRDDKIGIVGSKLIYPDGLLQEAGGIVWKDASAWNYGNRRNPEDPEFNYVKEADYISGAAVMIRRSLWEEIGGFDGRFAPAYYEDTDLAFEVRKRGYKVMYQPLSRVVHYEGVSNGTNLQTGLKQYQQVNFSKFYEKWKAVLEAEHEQNGENVFTAKDRSGRKKHILVVDHYVPHYDQDAGGKCTFMYLRTFVKMGFQVTFIGDNFYRHEPYTTELNQMGIEVLYGNYYYRHWQEWLKENGHYFDVIYLQRPHISVKYIDLAKKYSQGKIFYFAHDLHHIREYREYEMTKDPEKLASSRKWKKTEYELFEKADVGHVVGSFEQQKMQEAFPGKPIRNIPLYIYEEIPEDINKDFAGRKDLLYVGGFGHPPNIDAVLWFAREVYPQVLQRYPDMKWHVVGGKVPVEVQKLASDNILIEGFLPDEALERLYRQCRMSVVPLRFGAGVKGKVVEAAYYQIPLVTTSIGAEGLSLEEHFMAVEDEAGKLAETICALYEDYGKLREMSDNGIAFIRNHFTLEEAERVLRLDIDGR